MYQSESATLGRVQQSSRELSMSTSAGGSPWTRDQKRQYDAVAKRHLKDDGIEPSDRDALAYHRRGEIIVHKADLGRFERAPRFDQCTRRSAPFGYAIDDAPESRSPLPFALYQAPPGVGPLEYANELRTADLGLRAAPNHVMFAMPYAHASVGPPQFAEPLEAPEGDAGDGVVVGVVDTGVWTPHPWFTDRVGPLSSVAIDEELPEGQPLPAEAGHGTFVAGVIRQIAPGARVVVAGTLNPWGYATDADVAAAINALVWANVKVINLSLGGYTDGDLGPVALASVLETLPPDVAVVASAGNKWSTRPIWPAAFSGVLAVGALERASGQPAPWTNYGQWVDACAPGVDVVSTFFGGAGNPAELKPAATPRQSVPFEGFATWSGTSFAAPQLAGAIAVEMSRSPGTSARVAAAKLLSTGRVVRGLGTEFSPSL